MKAVDYKKLKKEAEEQYQRAIDMAEKDRLEAIAAIDKVWSMMNPRRRKTVTSTTPVSSQYGSLIETVRKSLQLVPHRFTKKNVLAAMNEISSDIAKTCNPNSLAGCLHRLKREGVIAQVKEGRGSTPAEYELVAIKTNENSKEQEADTMDNNTVLESSF